MTPNGNSAVKPESQSVRGCSKLREDCQSRIFDKMDKQHGLVMDAINRVDKKISFMEGKASVTVNTTNGKKNTKEFFTQAIITWAPWLTMVLVLGIVALLKSKGLL